MYIYLTLFGAVLSASANEFMNLVNEKEFIIQDHKLLKEIVPGYSSQGFNDNDDLQFFSRFSEDNQKANIFYNYVERGVTTKGLTFNIYDDEMRNATIALFRLFSDTDQTNETTYYKLKKWAKYNVNNDILDYTLRLTTLFSNSHHSEKFLPPYIVKPNLFVSGDTIMKAFYFRVNNGKINEDVKSVYQILNLDDNTVAINTNYSLCHIPFEQCVAQVKYFTEDVALNSYYYGLHLLHPFWMTDDELNESNPRHAAHYYFAHQQLYARYLLEKEHIDESARIFQGDIEPDFQAGLYYENGLSFPIRTSTLGRKIRKDVTFLQKIDLAITECIKRGIVKADNGSLIHVNEDNYMDLLAKFVRSQIESTKAAKVIRSVFGYATSGYPVDMYNPAPSVMHHPQTALRDPVYLYLIKRVVDYFLFYTNNTESYDLSKYETYDFMISDLKVSKISTSYKYFFINLYNSFTVERSVHNNISPINIYARQKRLNHEPFEIIFTVKSTFQQNVTIKLFLGPQCSIFNCWEMHYRFYQLDSYRHNLNEGSNIITWSTDTSLRYSSDQYFNKSTLSKNIDINYDIYKFPKNLVIPKGRKDGLNLTMFIIILDEKQNHDVTNSSLYIQITDENSNKPFGFPFHKKADKKTLNDNAPNYRFINITVFHVKESPDGTGYFSSYLY